jgi:hypothetical protein
MVGDESSFRAAARIAVRTCASAKKSAYSKIHLPPIQQGPMRYPQILAVMTLAATAVIAGCGGDDIAQQSAGDGGADSALLDGGATDGAFGDSAGGDSGRDAGSDSSAADGGGDGGDGGGAGDGGADGGTVTSKTGIGLVSGGTVSHSTSYTLIGTLAQSPGGNNTSKSTNYQLRGGVAGATQKP